MREQRIWQRGLTALFAAVFMVVLLVGCGQEAKQAAEQKAPAADSYTFTDQAGNEVTVKTPVERMVVLQHHSLDIICQLGGQDKIVGVESTWQRDLGDYIADI